MASARPAQYKKMSINLVSTINMDFNALHQLKSQLQDSGYVEFIWHKLFDNPEAKFETLDNYTAWNYPECWLARYWLNYIKHGHLIKDKKILEIGSNMNFYSVWAILNGANSVHCIEPVKKRYELGQEYVNLRSKTDSIFTQNQSIEDFIKTYSGEKYDIVYFQDVLYYLHNPLEVLHFIENILKPKLLFLETTVATSDNDQGYFDLWQPKTSVEKMQSWKKDIPFGLEPSRIALKKIINNSNWKILTYYDYKDFIGHGESPPRKEGRKDYYVLELTD